MKNTQISTFNRRNLTAAIICLGVGCTTLAQDSASSSETQVVRITQLAPSSPVGYFIFGETLLASAETLEDTKLARQVLALGIGLAMKENSPELAASMCIALAGDGYRSRNAINLWDLALMLDPNRRSAWQQYRNRVAIQEQQVREDASRCVHAARFNKPELASELIAKPGVSQAILTSAEQSGLKPMRVLGTVRTLIEQASDDSCHGRVFVTRRGDGVVTREVCPDHARPIGTAISQDAFDNLIRVEANLLEISKDHQSNTDWGQTAYLQLDVPAEDPSVSMILKLYRVDILKPYWKNDRWVSSR